MSGCSDTAYVNTTRRTDLRLQTALGPGFYLFPYGVQESFSAMPLALPLALPADADGAVQRLSNQVAGLAYACSIYVRVKHAGPGVQRRMAPGTNSNAKSQLNRTVVTRQATGPTLRNKAAGMKQREQSSGNKASGCGVCMNFRGRGCVIHYIYPAIFDPNGSWQLLVLWV